MAARPSRSLTVAVPLPPSYRGGTEEYAYRLVERFAESTQVDVFASSVRWDPHAAAVPTGRARVTRMLAFEVAERPIVVSPFGRVRFSAAVERSSMLQLHMPFPGFERSAVVTAQDAGVPSVLTYHMDADLAGVEPGRLARLVTALYRRWSADAAIRWCDAVVANSRGYAEASPVLSRHLAKVRVIHKGLDPVRLGLPARTSERPRPPSVPAELVPGGRKRLLFVGRLVPYKGLFVLLEAFDRLVADGHDVALLIAGRGPLAGQLLTETLRRRLHDRVGFLGFVPDAELGPLYRYADVVVAPSISSLEATATALEEGAACGTPVVGSALPGTAETVPDDGERGRLVPPGDADALAEALERLLDGPRPPPPERLRTWTDVARDYWALFEEIGADLGPFETSPSASRTAHPRGARSDRVGTDRASLRTWGALAEVRPDLLPPTPSTPDPAVARSSLRPSGGEDER